jgi:hypothetical protein
MRTTTAFLLASLLLGACVDDGELPDDDLDTTEEAITGGALADTWMLQRAVKSEHPCTATLIAPRYALTALHCTGPGATSEGIHVNFYTSGPGPAASLERTIVHVYNPPGTARPPNTDFYDSAGLYADIAILELDADAPASSVVATLAWEYPYDDAPVQQVGAGQFNGQDGQGILRKHSTTLLDEDYVPGMIRVTQDYGEPGDSGGPLYFRRELLSVHHGSGRGPSVPQHLPWILPRIGYVWPYGAVQQTSVRSGTVYQNFYDTTERVCQYITAHTVAEAYNYAPSYGICQLLTDVTQVSASSIWHSAAK